LAGSGFGRAKINHKKENFLTVLKCWFVSFENWRLLLYPKRPSWRPRDKIIENFDLIIFHCKILNCYTSNSWLPDPQ
jgi:hypothetical protein